MSKSILIGVALAALVVGGCGSKKEGGAGTGGSGGGGAAKPEASAPQAEVKLDAATAGVIKGKVTLKGTAPKMKEIDYGAKEQECLAGSGKGSEEWCVVGDGNALANVIVTVKKGPALGVKTPVPSEPVVIDQLHCKYVPHVAAMRAGQTMIVKSSDKTQHNVHMTSKLNGERNLSMNEPGEIKLEGDKAISLAESPKDLRFKCDVHPWMGAYIGAFKHDYFSVTKLDGAFELKNLPPGDYEIEAWHERFKSKPAKVTVGAKETKDVNFELEQ